MLYLCSNKVVLEVVPDTGFRAKSYEEASCFNCFGFKHIKG